MKECGIDNFYLELIEAHPCKTNEELRRREGHFIREFGTLNQNVAGQNRKEHYEANREKIRAYRKEYSERNREKMHAVQKEYREKKP